MRKLLHVEKMSRSQEVCERERVREYLQTVQAKIIQELKGDFSVQTKFDFGSWVIGELKKGFNGLLTHFPYDSNLMRECAFAGLQGEDFCRGIYRYSMEAMTSIREQFPVLPIVVYSGASTSPSNPIMDKLILEAGANRIVYRSDNLAEDARKIREHLTDLLIIP